LLEIDPDLPYPCARPKQSGISVYSPHAQQEETVMKNPLDSILGTIISGLVLTVVLFFFARNFLIVS
jgi:hypothetical protein